MTTEPRNSYLIESEAAKHVRKSPRSMQRHRQEGTGPRFYRVGGRILYAEEDLDAWVRASARLSTSDAGNIA